MRTSKIGLSLRYKLLFLLTTLPVLSLALYLFIATDLFKQDKIAYVYDSSATVSRSLATQMRIEMQGAYASLRTVVEYYDFAGKQFSPVAQDLFNKNPKIQAMAFFRHRADGNYEAMGTLGKPSDPAKKFLANEKSLVDLRSLAVQNTIWVGENNLGHGLAELSFRLGEKDAADHMVVIALYQADDMMNAFGAQGSYTCIVMGRGGKVSIDPEDAMPADVSVFQGLIKPKLSESTAESKLRDGRDYLISYAAVGMGDLFVVSRVDRAKALKAVDVLIAKSILFFVALIAFTVLISVIASGTLTSALRELFEATQKIANGDFNVRVEPRSRDEVGGLAESFNVMAAEVSRLMSETAEKARLQSELNTVKTVQETLFPPSQAQFGPLRITGHFEPASECGGDWWSYSKVGNKIHIWVGDATGHGAPAALITSAARSAAAVIDILPEMNPGKALSIMNRAVYETSKGKIMMTFFIATIDIDRGTMTYACASHDPPYMLRRTGRPLIKKDIVPLNDVNGPRLGDRSEFQYKDVEVSFTEGDMVFFYTDGLLDIQDPAGKKWGEREFYKSLLASANNGHDTESKISEIRDVIDGFRSGSSLIDDVTMVMVEFEATARAAA